MAKKETVEVPKEEYEELKRSNGENAEVTSQLMEKLDRVEKAQLAGVGIDPKIAARLTLPFKRVQFLEHYSRTSVPSQIQKGVMVIESYAVSAGDIVDIRKDEFDRIMADFPKKMQANPNKFSDKLRMKPEPKLDPSGRPKVEMVEDNIPVKVLLENAYEVG